MNEIVCNLFNAIHLKHQISRSTVSCNDKKFEDTECVKDKLIWTGRLTMDKYTIFDHENLPINVRKEGYWNIGKLTNSNIFEAAKYHPYKVRLFHELAEDDGKAPWKSELLQKSNFFRWSHILSFCPSWSTKFSIVVGHKPIFDASLPYIILSKCKLDRKSSKMK